jgi:CRISPR-associated protein Csm4
MNCFKIEIEPTSSFATKFESDTLFGSFCWNLLYKYGEIKLKALLKKYDTEPFIIFSNAFFFRRIAKTIIKTCYI